MIVKKVKDCTLSELIRICKNSWGCIGCPFDGDGCILNTFPTCPTGEILETEISIEEEE